MTYTDAAGESHTLLASDHVLLCTGGLQTPRDVALPEQAVFGGDVILGIGSEVDNTDLAGKHVAVLGMGAFAVENARTGDFPPFPLDFTPPIFLHFTAILLEFTQFYSSFTQFYSNVRQR